VLQAAGRKKEKKGILREERRETLTHRKEIVQKKGGVAMRKEVAHPLHIRDLRWGKEANCLQDPLQKHSNQKKKRKQ